MNAQEKTVRERILEALIAGDEICATDFAKQIGTSANAVTNKLRGFGDMVKRRDASSGPGNHRVFYIASNVAKLREKLEDEVSARCGNGGPRLRFDELLEAWGIATKPIKLSLPTFTHTMYDEPEAA